VFDFALMSIEGLWERKFRFSLNLVGILIGCAAVTGLAMTESMRNNIYNDPEVVGATTIQVYPTASTDDVAYNIKDKLDNVGVFTAEMALNQVNKVLGTINAVLGGIAGISLLVAGVGIINTMTVSMLEST